MDKKLIKKVESFLSKSCKFAEQTNKYVSAKMLRQEFENLKEYSSVLQDVRKDVIKKDYNFDENTSFGLVKYMNQLAKTYALFEARNNQEVMFTEKSLKQKDAAAYLKKQEQSYIGDKLKLHTQTKKTIYKLIYDYDEVTTKAFGESFKSIELLDKVVSRELDSATLLLKNHIVAPLRSANLEEIDNHFVTLEAIKQELYECVQLANSLIKAEKTLFPRKQVSYKPKFVLMDIVKSTIFLKDLNTETLGKKLDDSVREINQKIRESKNLDLIIEGDWHQQDEFQIFFNGEKEEFIKICTEVLTKNNLSVRLAINTGKYYNLSKENDAFKVFSEPGILSRKNLNEHKNVFEINKNKDGKVVYFDNKKEEKDIIFE